MLIFLTDNKTKKYYSIQLLKAKFFFSNKYKLSNLQLVIILLQILSISFYQENDKKCYKYNLRFYSRPNVTQCADVTVNEYVFEIERPIWAAF